MHTHGAYKTNRTLEVVTQQWRLVDDNNDVGEWQSSVEMMKVAVVRRWRRWRWWRMKARGDGDGVAVIDLVVAWLEWCSAIG
nr:hypothetical protein [Tanacetum cinerariifolium]